MNEAQSSFKLSHNIFSTYTGDEYRAMLTGGARGLDLGIQEVQAVEAGFEKVELPDEVDWRSKGAIGPVHNGGSMPIPYAEIDALSAAQMIYSGQLFFDISTQQYMDCSSDTRQFESVFKYAQTYGFESSQDYPASPYKNTCHFDATKVKVKIDSIKKVQGTTEAIKTALLDQPVIVLVDASNFVFQTYTSGILDSDKCGTQLNHEMLAVGYGKYDGGSYYILKNSWGASWGDHGYIKIKAADGKGVCGMNQIVEQPTLTSKE